MANERILIHLSSYDSAQSIEKSLRPAGYEILQIRDATAISKLARAQTPALIILGDKLAQDNNGQSADGLELVTSLLKANPSLAIVVIAEEHSDQLAIKAFREGALDFLSLPVRPDDLLLTVQRAIQRRQQIETRTQLEVRLTTKSLQQRLDSQEALQGIGRAITASLELDMVLTAVVDAAVKLTDAEEGSLLLLDDNTGELYIRAARNLRDEFVRTFRVPVSDSLAGEVVRSGKPILLNEKTPQKIKTAYLVHSLLYVPLIIEDHVIGVLGVDNRQSGPTFTNYHMTLVSALAGYAAIAVQNANTYAHSELERRRFETILTDIQDAVIVMDAERRLVLINQTARQAFGIPENGPASRLLDEAVHNSDLLELLGMDRPDKPYRGEISLEDGRVFNAQVTPIAEVGLVVTMQDITHLKELDRIKSDFVNTVSHDLRSPLTAILGYVELIERTGPVNAQQSEFIRRVELSVQAITALINDLLDLGRIEAGFDARKEIVPFSTIVNFTLDGLRTQMSQKKQRLELFLPETPSYVIGNPVRLRQMTANLIGNAVKYTQGGGILRVHLLAEAGQLIFQVSDNGPGIPVADQPYIFDKFYRGSNIASDISGTGLGLAIVKSIVENHHGRIWVESTPGENTTFTVVLPTVNQEL